MEKGMEFSFTGMMTEFSYSMIHPAEQFFL